MATTPTPDAATGCPPWCRMNHAAGTTFHACVAGELHLSERDGVVLAVVRRPTGDGVEVTYHVADEAPAVAFLGRDDARRLREYLDSALGALDAA